VEVVESEPHGVEEQVIDHVTPLLLLSFSTVAVNGVLPPHCTLAAPGEIATLSAGGGAFCVPLPQPVRLATKNTVRRFPTSDA